MAARRCPCNDSRMKQLVVVLALAAAGTARADQCQVVDADVADWAVKVLPKGASFVEQCEPCGDTGPTTPRVANTVRVDKKAGSVLVNGKVVDLAYVYVQTGKATYTNVALMTGCPTQGVAPSVTLRPAKAVSKGMPPGMPPECQRYFQIMERMGHCEKLPKESRDALRQGFDAAADAFKDSANLPPDAKKAMADACKQGSDALEQAMSSTGC